MKRIIFITIFIIIFIIMIKNNFREKFKENFEDNLYTIASELGINYLKYIKKLNIKNPTVMFDIDDTLLYVNDDFSLTPIKPIIKLLNYCLKNKITVLILTARDSRYVEQTKRDLSKNNINYDYLYLRISPQDDYNTFKSDIKKMYMDYYQLNIVMSIGDNDIDINGPNSGYSIKLPNKSDPRLFHINMENQLENIVP
jgi:predicted secreted acid phosphatase